MKRLFILCLILNAHFAMATCPMASLYEGKNDFMEWQSYEVCALEKNDSESQFFIGQVYLNGNKNIPQNLTKALEYFRMAAENGYAPAQRELAKLMDTLNDIGTDGQEAILEMEKTWQKKNKTAHQAMSALSWLMLAAERAENKWFYFAPAMIDEEAVRLLPAMKAKYGNEEVKKLPYSQPNGNKLSY